MTSNNQMGRAPLVERGASAPLFRQLKELLAAAIRGGDYLPGQAIPSERDLCRFYGVSRTTVRTALDQAVAEGLCYRVHGKGTYVAAPRVDQGLFRVTSFARSIRALGLVPGTRVLAAGRVPFDRATGETLGLSHSDGLFRLELLGLASGRPMALYWSYLAPALGTLVAARARQLSLAGEAFSTYELYAPEVGPRVTVRQTFAAAPAATHVTDYLELAAGAPVLAVTSVVLEPAGKPVEFRHAWYRGDMYRFHVDREHVLESVRDFTGDEVDRPESGLPSATRPQ
jgi:GntR family transcriptional regulator